MATQKQKTARPARSEKSNTSALLKDQQSQKSVTIKLSEDALPIGLMPPTFPPDYVAGSVVPFFLSGTYLGETPSLPMIDITLSKEGAVPIQWCGMLYEGWVPNPDEEG